MRALAALVFGLYLLVSDPALADADTLTPFEGLDFTQELVSREALAKIDLYYLTFIRGIVFGRHGRVFKDAHIQSYLERQTWYKPDPTFTNGRLTARERENLDLVREVEANGHAEIQPGDLRFWILRKITPEKLGTHTGAEWRILAAEVEAIHGKRFSGNEAFLQRYFEERYWYTPDPTYKTSRLSELEVRNLRAIQISHAKQRKLAISPGDIQHFENVPINEAMLKGLSLHELRLLRNEIFARRGRPFVAPWIMAHFSSYPWYEPAQGKAGIRLTPMDLRNVGSIIRYERKLHDALGTSALSAAMLKGMFIEDAVKLRNEISARHGMVFKDAALQAYFASFPWYKVDPAFVPTMLSPIERKNVATILIYEGAAISEADMVEG